MKKYIIGILIILILIMLFIISHKTYYKYNDWWIKGKTINNVQKNMANLIKNMVKQFATIYTQMMDQ